MPLDKTPTGPFTINKNTLKTITDAEAKIIVDTAKAYVEADTSVKPSDMKYSLADRLGTFAKVSVGTSIGGYYALLKNVNGIWVVILTAQDLPGKAFGQKYGLPEGWFSNEF